MLTLSLDVATMDKSEQYEFQHVKSAVKLNEYRTASFIKESITERSLKKNIYYNLVWI